MIITCQQCHTNYSVDAEIIGVGKSVRCQNCSSSWHQHPVAASPAYKPRPPTGPSTSLVGDVYPPQSIKSPREFLSNEDKNVELETESSSEDVTLSSELLDDIFGKDIEADAFYTDDSSSADDEGDSNTPDDFEDPEPIPGVFANQDGDQDDDEDSSGKGKKIGIAAIVLVLAISGVLFFGRSFIMDMIGGSQIGEGLDIQNVKSLRKDNSGLDILIVSGQVANISKEVRPVPMIKVVLYDGNEKEIEKTIIAPLKSSLKAGARIRFSAKITKPSALARRMEVTFTEAKKK